jgi:hypothetical protein
LVVHCFDRDHPPPPSLAKHVSTLDTVYPRIQSSLLCVQAPFTPVTIEWLSRELFIPKVHRQFKHHTSAMQPREGCDVWGRLKSKYTLKTVKYTLKIVALLLFLWWCRI